LEHVGAQVNLRRYTTPSTSAATFSMF